MRKELFAAGTMTLGVNYWASHAATHMWTDWRPDIVETDMQKLSSIGCKYLRVFPIWSDFQPIMVVRGNGVKGGAPREYRFTGERPLPRTEAGRAGVDETMMERFEVLCDLAEKYGVKLIVPLLNGHMTFRLYLPPALDGLDHFTDPVSLMWQGRFIRYFVKRMKHHPAIAAWESGNESSLMSATNDRAVAFSWSAMISDAIRSQDNTRPVCSGLNAMSTPSDGAWVFSDQAELCDVLTSHPYPHTRDAITRDRMNTLRWVLFTALSNQVVADMSGVSSFAEETGTTRRTFSTFEALGDNLRNALWMLWSNDSRALLWWCSFDQIKMEFPPYDWDSAGMEHGIMTDDHRLNPTGRAIRDFAAFMEKCPVKQLPPPREKAVCVVCRKNKPSEIAFSVGIPAKQAGLPLRFVYCEDELPDSSVYLIPCAQSKGGLNRAAYRTLWEKAQAGATVYFSLDYNSRVPLMDEFFGFEFAAREENSTPVQLRVGDIPQIRVMPKHRFTVESHGAVPLDPDGIFWEYKVGKGRIITAVMPLETAMLSVRDSYRKYRMDALYRMIGENIVSNNLLYCEDCDVVITEHPENDSTVYAIVANCYPEEKTVSLRIREGWTIESIHSDIDGVTLADQNIRMPKNSGALLVLKYNPIV